MRSGPRIAMASCLLAALAACAAAAAPAVARGAALRDVEGYAIASCLAAQDSPYLKDQGDGWASVIVQRGKGDLRVFAAVAAAVKAELAKGDMAIIRTEAGPAADKPLPVLYCGEIIDKAGVRAAINEAAAKLRAAYRRQ